MQKNKFLVHLGVLGAILLICIVGTSLYAPENIEINQLEINPRSSDTWYISPFVIDGNGAEGMTWEEYRAANEPWLSGKGSIEIPYVIKNIVIDAAVVQSCIRIVNSERYFKIENCGFYNAPESGISLSHVSNGIIVDNDCSFNRMGISLDPECENNIIQRNIVNSNTEYGMNIMVSSHNNISENTVNSNGVMGINLEPRSPYNKIVGNTVNYNGWLGIHMQDGSSNNLILSNNCSYNNEGISVRTSKNIISGNFIEYNGRGIHFWSPDSLGNPESNNITGNFINYNQFNLQYSF